MDIDLREPFLSKSVSDTEQYAKTLFAGVHSHLDHATVFTLQGDLGAGKTTFAKCFARCFGIDEDLVTSPTFVIQKQYAISEKGFSQLIHIDAYRIENPNELVVIGWNDIILDPKHLILIEWPEHAQDLIPQHAHSLTITYAGEEGRIFTYRNS